MPGNLYFYVNFATILLNKTQYSTTKSLGRPQLWDIFWDISYHWVEARGFAGFSEQVEVKRIKEFYDKGLFNPEEELRLKKEAPNVRDLLRHTDKNLGKPMFLHEAQDFMFMGNRGFGKDLEENSIVYLKDREIPIKDVKLGDLIYGYDGKLTKVLTKQTYNNQLQYKITLRDGREVECGGGHLWEVTDFNNKRKVLETKELYKDYLYGKNKSPKYFIDYTRPVEYEEKELLIDPYFLGLWLGDGNKEKIAITTKDKEIINYVYNIAKKEEKIVNINCNKNKTCPTYVITKGNKTNENNSLLDKFKELNLLNNKHIPQEYIYSSIEQRMELLRGLMDSDGTILKSGNIEFSNTNKILIDNLIKILNSLGIRNTLSKRMGSYTKNGVKKKTRVNYRIKIITSEPIFKLKRKLERLNNNLKPYSRSNREKVAIVKIEPTSVKPSVCIGVDNDRKLFLTNNCVITHNSYFVANGMILPEFLFDGMREYSPELSKNPPTTEIVVGAGDAKYSTDLLKKTRLSLENLPGGIQLGDKYYPAPFDKKYKGSWEPGKEIIAKYRKKEGGTWREVGSGSTIKHRTYADNPFAAQGTRPAVMVKEEIGMFSNLIASQEADVETMKSGTRKFGSCVYLGTGGDMDKGTLDALKMFYDPQTYNLLTFNDEWENKGKIAYFSPATHGKVQYKDNYGNTKVDLAIKEETAIRERIKKGKNAATALDAYIQYNPIVPSEMFLVKKGNIFPVAEALDTLAKLERNDRYNYTESIVELYFDSEHSRGVNYKVDTSLKHRPIIDWPLKAGADREGAVIIYEFPIEIDGKVPKDLYILGHDPYKSDEDSGESLGSIFVLKNKKYFKQYGHDEIVAEYIGRPEDGRRVVNEILEKLWMFYGSPPRGIYFENAVGNVKEYFEKRKKLHALATQPETILSKTGAFTKSGNVIYGYPMSNDKIKAESELYLRDWLLEARGETEDGSKIHNINLIKSRMLLKQLISYNRDGNFDAVMGLMGCVIGLEETHNQYTEKIKEQEEDILDFLNKKVKQRYKPSY